MRYQAPRGTADILPEDQPYWNLVRDTARDLARRYGYRRIDTPAFEDASLFVRSVGEGTDIVEKEMYTFKDRGGDDMTLRPEGTAPVCRAYLQHGMQSLPQPVRLFYIAPIFRYERPQAGRYRQHWQFGIEAIGDASPEVDAEVVHLLWSYLTGLGLQDLTLLLNSIGDGVCRPGYLGQLRAHYAPHLEEVCPDCRVRYQKNALRLLDCKQDRCQPIANTAPAISDHLCESCGEHFSHLRHMLDLWQIPYRLTPRLVRGLDYYTRTVFEVQPREAAAQTALGGGGRYDGLIEQLGGPVTAGVGFGSGIERVILNLKAAGIAPTEDLQPALFIASLGEQAHEHALRLAAQLRDEGLAVHLPTGQRSLRAQLRNADQVKARRALILGDNELAKGVATLRDLASGEQREVALDDVKAALATRVD